MWKYVRFTDVPRKLGNQNVGRFNGPKESGDYLVTFKVMPERFTMVANYHKETNTWIDDGGCDISQYIIAFDEDGTLSADPYDDNRRNEEYMEYAPAMDLCIASKQSLSKYYGKIITEYSFNNVIVKAKLAYADNKSGYECVVSVYSAQNKKPYVIVAEYKYDGSFLHLREYILSVIPYDEIMDTTLYEDKDGWNVCLQSIEDNHVMPFRNTPKESGDYLCTCVSHIPLNPDFKYLRMMHWNNEKRIWQDICGRGVSHNVLAWKEESICEFDNYDYVVGGVLIKKGGER